MCQSAAPTAAYPASAGSLNFGQYSPFSLLLAGVNAVLGLVELQRQRRALASLNEHQLRDIGISAAEARRAVATPFWR